MGVKSYGVLLGEKIGIACIRVNDAVVPRWIGCACMDVERVARGIATQYKIDLDAAIVAKFNKTSIKNGLATRMG